MKRKYFLFYIILLLELFSCGLVIPEYDEYMIFNSTDDAIKIESFVKKDLKNSITIKSDETYQQFTVPGKANTSPYFLQVDVDSVVISNSEGKITIYSCKGQSLQGCPNLQGTPIDLNSNWWQKVNKNGKLENGKVILNSFKITLTNSIYL